MALFKILQGKATDLNKQQIHEGYCYVTVDEKKFYVDLKNERICLNSATADKFSTAREIKLTGDVIGSVSSDGASGWSIATTIPGSTITNAMLAGSITNSKLVNSAITVAGNNISLGDSISAATLRESLGLSNAMHFVGIATVAITDGSTTNPSIDGYTTKQKGDVIIDKDSAYEYVWTGDKWERLGGDGSYKTVQSAVVDPTASGNSSTFIKTISQNENGVITATKATIANHIIQVNGIAAGTYNGGAAVTLNLKEGNGIAVTNSSGTITFAHSNSVTAKTAYGATATTASADGGEITVTDVKYDAQGHITGSTDRTIVLSQTTYTLAGLGGVPTNRTVNGKALSSDISLTANDVNALPLAGGTMTGYISWGNAPNAGLEWTTDNGTRIHLRPYSPSNIFQLTLKPTDGEEFGAINVDTSGNISFKQALPISSGGTGASDAATARTNLGAAAANHTHSYLPLSGGILTGDVTGSTISSGWIYMSHKGAFNMSTAPTSSSAASVVTAKTSSGSWGIGTLYGNESLYFVYGTDANYNAGTNTTVNNVRISNSGGVYGAVWNDYAEFRTSAEQVMPGQVVYSDNKGELHKTTERLQAFEGVVSDTFGFAIGETDDAKTPLAVAGRVLVYPDEDRYTFHAGDAVCAGKFGTVSKMTREEIIAYPDRIVGIVSEIPEYETWGSGNVPVYNRIWIRVK